MAEVKTGTTFLNLDLHIKKTGKGYQARILQAPAKQAIVNFDVPFSKLELDLFSLQVHRHLQKSYHPNAIPIDAIRAFGGQLFQTIFNRPMQTYLHQATEHMAQKGDHLRIWLHLTDAPTLAHLPWEYLYLPQNRSFFALSPTSLVRYHQPPQSVQIGAAPLAQRPLKVLVMISSPKNRPVIDVEQEWRKLRQTLSLLERHRLIVLERLTDATLETLQEKLGWGGYHIFHFIGYADPDDDQGGVLFRDEMGFAQSISGQVLGKLLRAEETLRLAFFNTANYQYNTYKNPLVNAPQGVMQIGLPAAIAAPFEMTDKAAATLVYVLYHALANGDNVDMALSRARRLIFAQDNNAEWGNPLLYLCSPNSQLFALDEGEAAARQREQIALFYRQAIDAYNDQDLSIAQEKLGQVRQMDPAHPETLFLLTQMSQEKKILGRYLPTQEIHFDDPQSEIPAAPRLVETDTYIPAPKLVETLLKVAQTAFAQENWPLVNTKLAALLELDPANRQAAALLKKMARREDLVMFYQRGAEYYQADDWQRALDYFRAAQEIDAEYKQVTLLVSTVEKLVQYQYQQQHLETLNQQLYAAFYLQAQRHYRAGRWQEALTCLNKIRDADGTNQNVERLVQLVKRQMAQEAVAEAERAEAARQNRLFSGLLGVLATVVVALLLVVGFIFFRNRPQPPTAPATSPLEGTVLPVALATFTATPSPTLTPIPTPIPQCSVVSSALNLRNGPGLIYDPPLRTLPQNAILRPLARDEAAEWILVWLQSSGETGWVTADPAFTTCNMDLSTLGLGHIPPTPTAVPPAKTSDSAHDCVPYNPDTLKIVNEGPRGWLLTDGNVRLQIFDTAAAAQEGLAKAKQYKALCYMDADTPSFVESLRRFLNKLLK